MPVPVLIDERKGKIDEIFSFFFLWNIYKLVNQSERDSSNKWTALQKGTIYCYIEQALCNKSTQSKQCGQIQ